MEEQGAQEMCKQWNNFGHNICVIKDTGVREGVSQCVRQRGQAV